MLAQEAASPPDNGKLAAGSRGRSGQAMGSSLGSRMHTATLCCLRWEAHCERELGEDNARQLASLDACLPSTLHPLLLVTLLCHT